MAKLILKQECDTYKMTMKQRTRILMIYTGGTIGMIENPETHALQPFDFNHLIDNVPKIKMLDYDISNIQFEEPIDSSAINPSHWAHIARIIEENYCKYDGFVVLHGTDTMAYTASALSFMLKNLGKPVIITGSQLPIGEVRTDGEENLITSLQVAAAKDSDGLPMIREVAILFENYLWRGNRSTKYSADYFNAFKSNNYPQLAKMGLGITYNREAIYRPFLSLPLEVNTKMDTNVLYLNLFPGINESTVRHILSAPNLKGVILKTFGAGNAPTECWFIDAIRDAVKRGIVIVNVTQCNNGSVHPMRYITGYELAQAGVISGHDLTSEAAITKLMFLLGQGLSTEEVKRRIEHPIVGEMTIGC